MDYETKFYDYFLMYQYSFNMLLLKSQDVIEPARTAIHTFG